MADHINPELHPIAVALRQKLIEGGMILQQEVPHDNAIELSVCGLGCAANIDGPIETEDYANSFAVDFLARSYPPGSLFYFKPMVIWPHDDADNPVGYDVRHFQIVFWQPPAAAAE